MTLAYATKSFLLERLFHCGAKGHKIISDWGAFQWARDISDFFLGGGSMGSNYEQKAQISIFQSLSIPKNYDEHLGFRLFTRNPFSLRTKGH